MRSIILSSVGCLAVPNFSTLSHKRRGFWKNLSNIKFVLIFSTTFVRNISYTKKIERDVIIMYIGFHVKYPLFFSDFNET